MSAVPESETQRPPYAIPLIGEAIRVFDASDMGGTVAAVYLGFERVADDFFMHNVRRGDETVESIASYNVYRGRPCPDGTYWESLTPKPRAR